MKNKRSRVIIESSSSEAEEMINCYCGYEEEYPLGTPCPGCNEVDDEYTEEDISNTTLSLKSLKNTNPTLYKSIMEVTTFLEEEFPSIQKLLTTPLSLKDRAHLVELYEVIRTMPQSTPEYLMMKEQLVDRFKTAVRSEKLRLKWSSTKRKEVEDELGALEEYNGDDSLEYQISALDLPRSEKVKIYQRYKLWETMETSNEEYGKAYQWINTVVNMPWNVYSQMSSTNLDKLMHRIQENFDKNFYGLQSVKEQLLLFVHHRILYPNSKSYMLGLLGPPGTGKTSIVQTLSESLDTPIYSMTAGSLSSVDGIYGHSYTYVGSEPGEFAKACLHMKTLDGIVFIDEFEKIPMDKCLGALLHVLDPVQNHKFRDRYLDIPIDLSKLFFVCSMNSLPEDRALRDRIYPIHLRAYTFSEKFNILKRIALPRILKTVEIPLTFSDDALRAIMQYAGNDDGMRYIIQITQDVVRKLCFLATTSCDVSFKNKLGKWNKSMPVLGDHIHALVYKDTLGEQTKFGMYM